jgi:hypothetical protein
MVRYRDEVRKYASTYNGPKKRTSFFKDLDSGRLIAIFLLSYMIPDPYLLLDIILPVL